MFSATGSNGANTAVSRAGSVPAVVLALARRLRGRPRLSSGPRRPAASCTCRRPQPSATLEADGQAPRASTGRRTCPPTGGTLRLGASSTRLVAQALASKARPAAAEASLRASQDNLRAGYGVFFPQVGASLASDASAARRSAAAAGPRPDAGGALQPLDAGRQRQLRARPVRRPAPGRRGARRRGRRPESGAARGVSEPDRQRRQCGDRARRIPGAAQATAAVVRCRTSKYAWRRPSATRERPPTGPCWPARATRRQRSRAAGVGPEHRPERAPARRLSARVRPNSRRPPWPGANSTLPAELPDTLPAALARHRPDILAAEARLHPASAQIGVATADLLPSLTLGGTAGAPTPSCAGAHRRQARLVHAASLAGSLFSGGSQWYRARRRSRRVHAALGQYETTVLAALEQVADTMRALDLDARALAAVRSAAAAERARLTQPASRRVPRATSTS